MKLALKKVNSVGKENKLMLGEFNKSSRKTKESLARNVSMGYSCGTVTFMVDGQQLSGQKRSFVVIISTSKSLSYLKYGYSMP